MSCEKTCKYVELQIKRIRKIKGSLSSGMWHCIAGKVVRKVLKQPVAFINKVSRAQLHLATLRLWVFSDVSKERVSLTSKASMEETTLSDTAPFPKTPKSLITQRCKPQNLQKYQINTLWNKKRIFGFSFFFFFLRVNTRGTLRH